MDCEACEACEEKTFQTRFANKNTHCGIHGHTHTHLCSCVCMLTQEMFPPALEICTVQVSGFLYPRVQFKVRVFRAPVVTGTVPVVLYTRTFVERCHKHGAASAKRAYIKAYAAQRRIV